MELIDLTMPIDSQTKSHRFDTPPRLFQDRFLDKDHFNNFRMEMGCHVGTHIDAPMHLEKRNKFISEYELDRFMGLAQVIDARGRSEITAKHLPEKLEDGCHIVLVHTGHSRHYPSDDYFRSHPIITVDFARELVRRKVKILGIDLPSPDVFPFEIHKTLFASDVLIIENLVHLDKIRGRRVRLIALPLNIQADASPARVIVEVLEESPTSEFESVH